MKKLKAKLTRRVRPRAGKPTTPRIKAAAKTYGERIIEALHEAIGPSEPCGKCKHAEHRPRNGPCRKRSCGCYKYQ